MKPAKKIHFSLCLLCIKRHALHPLAKKAKECFVCEGKMHNIKKLCDEAISLSKEFEYATFSVSTTFEKPLLLREEQVRDKESLNNTLDIKNQANNIATAYIQNKTKKSPMPNTHAQLCINLNFKSNRAKAVPANLCIFGHYIKNTRKYCQHTWACSFCNGKGCKKCDFHAQNYPSIESALRNTFAPAFGAQTAYLHASGREDVDVMNLGGRPFVLELVSPKKRNLPLAPFTKKVKESFPLEATDLQYCPSFWIETICTSHFDKHYRAIVEAGSPLGAADFEKIREKFPLTISQLTPIRVLGRRADLKRKRRVFSIKLHGAKDGKLTLDIFAEAGTYIKELIHSDEGRTSPSISSILGKKCGCAQLDVLKIDDLFIQTLAKK